MPSHACPSSPWSLATPFAAEPGEGRAERRRTLDERRTVEIEPRAALVDVIGGIERRGDFPDQRPDLDRERLARAFVTQTRHRDVEATVVRLRQIRKARLVAGHLDRSSPDRLALPVPHPPGPHVTSA